MMTAGAALHGERGPRPPVRGPAWPRAVAACRAGAGLGERVKRKVAMGRVFHALQVVQHLVSGRAPRAGDVIEINQNLFLNNDILASAAPSGADTVITDTAGDTITLQNVAPTNLHASDFHLV